MSELDDEINETFDDEINETLETVATIWIVSVISTLIYFLIYFVGLIIGWVYYFKAKKRRKTLALFFALVNTLTPVPLGYVNIAFRS